MIGRGRSENLPRRQQLPDRDRPSRITRAAVAIAVALSLPASRIEVAHAAAWPPDNGGGSFGQFFGFQPPPYRRQSEPFTWFGPGPFWGPPPRFFSRPRPARAATYRTLCVRICDGYYFPISYATTRSRFKTDAAACQSMYPSGEAALYVHRTSGQDATEATSLTGKPLADESFAFAYRSTYDHACATLFRSGSGAHVAIRKAPLPDPTVTSSLTSKVSWPQRGGQSPASPNAVLTELAPSTDGVPPEGPVDHVMRTVGPAYYYDTPTSTGGEPAKVAAVSSADTPDASADPSDEPPLAASILPDPVAALKAAIAGITGWHR